MVALHLQLLGAMRVTDAAGHVLDVKAKKARALLAVLALHPRHTETRARLAALLWGDMSDDRARANLRQCISTLRAALHDDAEHLLVSTDDALRLDTAHVRIDVDELARLAATDEDCERAAQLCTGELLADLVVDEEALDEWLRPHKEAAARSARDLWSRLARARATRDDVAGAEGALLCWLAIEPASEDAHRALIELYATSGRRSKALDQLERCKAALKSAFDVEPEPATLALAHRVANTPPPAPAPLPLANKPSVAVLPFAETPAPADGDTWFGDGVAEDVIVALTKFDRLLVIARQSSFVFRAPNVDVREVGRALGVHYVLCGTVRRGAGRVRLAVHLADATTAAAVWSHTYDVADGAAVEAESEIVETVVATLAGRVEADQIARVRRGVTQNLEANDCLWKAKAYHHRYTRADNSAARECLDRALALDPEFALAHAWMACVLVQGAVAFTGDQSAFDVGYRHVKRALDIDEADSETHRILAAYYIANARLPEAEVHQARALALNPHDDRIVCQQGELMTFTGDAPSGVAWIEKAMRLNPYHADGVYADHGRALYYAGDVVAARKSYLSIRNHRVVHLGYLAACCARLGELAQARVHLTAARAVSPTFTPDGFVAAQPFARPELVAPLRADLARVA